VPLPDRSADSGKKRLFPSEALRFSQEAPLLLFGNIPIPPDNVFALYLK
jgi:hypothetical protein